MRKTLIWSAVAIVLLIAFLPMRLVLDWSGLTGRGLSAASVQGSVWSSSIRDLKFGRLALGDMEAGLTPLPLLTGTTALTLDRLTTISGGPPLRMRVESNADSFAISDAEGEIETQGLFAPLPLQRVVLQAMNVRFAGGQCKLASGSVRIDLEQSLFGLTVRQGLSGNVRCDRGALLVPLKGQSGLDGLDIRISGDGSYRGELRIGGIDSGMAASLGSLGFAGSGDTLSLPISGQF